MRLWSTTDKVYLNTLFKIEEVSVEWHLLKFFGMAIQSDSFAKYRAGLGHQDERLGASLDGSGLNTPDSVAGTLLVDERKKNLPPVARGAKPFGNAVGNAKRIDGSGSKPVSRAPVIAALANAIIRIEGGADQAGTLPARVSAAFCMPWMSPD